MHSVYDLVVCLGDLNDHMNSRNDRFDGVHGSMV